MFLGYFSDSRVRTSPCDALVLPAPSFCFDPQSESALSERLPLLVYKGEDVDLLKQAVPILCVISRGGRGM
jgi:hypothetical protein